MNEEYKIKGWVAREDADFRKGRLLLFGEKPYRDGNYGWRHSSFYTELNSNFYPGLAWKDEPIEVELTIKKL